MQEQEFDFDAARLDGGNGSANIFDLDDVFDREKNELVPEPLGEAFVVDEEVENEVEPAAPDDDYVPDDELGRGDRGGPLIHYDGGALLGIPTRDDLVARSDTDGLTTKLARHFEERRPVFFMPTDIEETTVYTQGHPVYALKLYGAMMNGAKAEVTITGIDVFFDVCVPSNSEGIAKFEAHLRQTLTQAGIPGLRIETVMAFPDRGFHPTPVPFKRVFPSTLQTRKRAIAAVRDAGMDTKSDDRSCYYRKAAREYGLPLSDWAVLEGYTYAEGPTEKSPLCAHVLTVPVANYKPLVDAMAPKEKREAGAKTKAKVPLLVRDRTMVVAWDIETYNGRGTGELPTAEHDADVCFMICLSAHWKDDTTPLAQVCIVDVATAPDPRWTTIVCGGGSKNAIATQTNMIRALALCLRAFAPDIVAGFNDSEYDWPFIVEKARRFGILPWFCSMVSASPRRGQTDESILRFNYCTDRRIKITAEEVFYSSYLKLPGMVPIDVRVCYKKLHPKSETPKAGSLKFYLEISGLPGKADMPVKRMWGYYEAAIGSHKTVVASSKPTRAEAIAMGQTISSTAEHMRHVAHYCVIDAVRCQALLVRRNIINDYREVSTLAFVSLFDSHYYAGGMKVCNLLGAYAWRRNILTSMVPKENPEQGKYPGAYVFPPEKGIVPHPDRMAALDAAAADYRASISQPEIRAARAMREQRIGAGITPAEVAHTAAITETMAVEFRQKLEKALEALAADRPVTGLDYSSLYPSIIMTYNLSPEKILLSESEATYWRSQGLPLHEIRFVFNGRTVRGWSVRHENQPDAIGLYPTVLIDLFNKRAEVKVVLGQHKAVLELIDVIQGRAQEKTAAALMTGGMPKEVAEKQAKGGVTPTALLEAMRSVAADAETEKAATAAAMAPGAPPPRISPGSTLAEELADLKRRNKVASGQIEGVRRLVALADPDATLASIPAETLWPAVRAETDRASFDKTCADSKQNALKVYMNTFYGEAGNSLSPYFLLELAGGVTSAGQENIKKVAELVQSRGFRVKYGDTDSLYLQAPNAVFAECDMEFVMGRLTREEWWTAMVRITMRALNQIRDEVNEFLKRDNGTKYLKMAYEEVLYPVVFTGKKKYFGTPHENEVNFRPKKLFIKGIDVVKQGQPGMAREIGNRIMWACVAIGNTRVVKQIVEDVLRDAVLNGAQWNFEHFIRTDAWKPQKKNIAVHRFIARMRARHSVEVADNAARVARGETPRPYIYELPEPGERFSYVIAKVGASFDLHGRKSALKKGDRMEFARAAAALHLEIDVAYYMVSYVVGLCARFLSAEEMFRPAAVAGLAEKKIDETVQKNAKKYLDNYVKGLSNLDGEMMKKRGYAYRRAYRAAADDAWGALVSAVGPTAANVLDGGWLNFELFGDEESDAADDAAADPVSTTVNNLWQAADAYAEQLVAADPDWCRRVALELGIEANGTDSAPSSRPPSRPGSPPPAVAAKVPPSKAPATNLFATPPAAAKRGRAPGRIVATQLASTYDRMEADIRARIAEKTPAVVEAAMRYEADLSILVDQHRLAEHHALPEIGAPEANLVAVSAQEASTSSEAPALASVGQVNTQVLLDLRKDWLDAVGVQIERRRTVAYHKYIAALKDKRANTVAAPSKAERNKILAEAAAKLRVSGDTAF